MQTNVYQLSVAVSNKTLRSKLYIMQLLLGEWELALSLSVKRQTLRDFINGNRTTPSPRMTPERLEQIAKHYITYKLPQNDAIRQAHLWLLHQIYPKLLPTTHTGSLTTSSKKSRTLSLVRDYIIDQRNKGKQTTMQQIVDHFQSPRWVKQYGYPLKEHTIRSNIRRALGKWPELSEVIIPARRGRRPGSKGRAYGTQAKE